VDRAAADLDGCDRTSAATNVGDRVRYATSFVIALAASVFLTFLVRAVARRLGRVARPRADRWHKRPTAMFGGVGMFLAFTLVYAIRRPAEIQGDALLFVCSAGMFGLGFLDDLVQLKPYTKLVGQIVFSTVFTMFGLRLHWLQSPVPDQALTI